MRDFLHVVQSGCYDYHNSVVRENIGNLKLKAKWYDYVSWRIPIVGTVGVGIYNGSKR